jgi:hypothetical protein
VSAFTALTARAAGLAIPSWAPWAAGALAAIAIAGSFYGLGRVHEARIGADELASYKEKAGIQTVRIVKGETQVVIKTEIEYRDRIQKIYVQGAEIEKHITDYVQPVDDARFDVNVGFLRNIDAAWSGVPVGPAADSDREPAGIPLSEIASVETGNATSCRVWRQQALGWRTFYADQQVAINGRAGEWTAAAAPDLQE